MESGTHNPPQLPRTRRSLLLMAPSRLEWVEKELPALQPGELLVATRAGAISVGTELPLYRGTSRAAAPARYPMMTGYESLGQVIARGAAVRVLRVGDRVVGFYGHRTHAVLTVEQAIPVPDAIGDALALLAILSCDVAKGVRRLQPVPDEPVLVTGAGTIGLLAVWTLATLGVTAIDVIEPVEARRRVALRLGARQAVAPGDELAAQGLYAAGIECSSRNAAFELLQAHLRYGGRICVLADGNIEPLTLAPDFHHKELSVTGSSDGWDYPGHARWFFDRIQHDGHALDSLFERRIVVSELAATFEQLACGAERPIKVFVAY